MPEASALAEIRRAITHVAVPHHEPPSVIRRRRIVVAVVLVLGAAVLGLSMTRHPGEAGFYWLTLALCAVWTVGALASGPLHLGGLSWRGRNQRPVISGATIGLLLAGAFVLGGLLTRQIPAAADQVMRVLLFVDQGSWRLLLAVALVDAIAEELFYRGALYSALGRHHPALFSVLLYVAATLASKNLMLGFAAAVLGTVCTWERRATGGVLAPILTHFVWSLVMVLALPPVFGL